jgi:hypothetical protein
MMNEKEALLLIEEMINSTKQEVKDNGFYYILWGWLVFIAAITDYVLLVFMDNKQHALVWAILMPLGGLVSVIKGRKDAKKQRVKTYIDEAIKYLSIAFSISLFIICFIMPMTNNSWRVFYPTLMVIYAFAVFIFGGLLRYKPLIYGAFMNWALAIVGYFVTYDWQLLLLALAVLCSFVIPGHLLNRRFHQHV